VTEDELRRVVGSPAPEEHEAGERAWLVVRAAYGTREHVPWLERHSRAVLALAAVAALSVAAISPPGRALVERVREAAGVSPSERALVRLPAPGRLLVDSEQGPWVVQQDGSKRLIGAYDAASWSPRGLFVVATRGQRLVALEPDGDARWTVTRPGRVADARWARSGFRIAYREGATLRVVAGDGTGDRLLARGMAPAAPAWHPDETRNVLAYAEAGGRIHVADVDTGEDVRSIPSTGSIAQLAWSADGSRLLAVSADGRARLYDSRGREVGGHEEVTRAAYSPVGDSLAYATYDPATDTSTVRLVEDGRIRTLFAGTGRFQDVVWAPNGRWLLVTWPAVDQWLFFRAPSVRGPVSVSNVAREFDPGGSGVSAFPRVAGWAPAAP
jgi:dipeptidyl aminopeptidase/acylaminoacyl peptidase